MVFVPTKRTLLIHAHWQRASIFVQAFCGRLRVARENSVEMTLAFSLPRIVFETKKVQSKLFSNNGIAGNTV